MYHEPTILTGVTSAMEIAREETFGPVAPIMRFDTLDEAIAIGNETDFGLTAAVFTNSLSDAWTAASELRHGTVHINETTELLGSDGAVRRSQADGIADAVIETKQITFDF